MAEIRNQRSAINPEAGTRPAVRASLGFTLLELLVVVAIIGILVGIMLPAIGGVKIKAQKKKAESDVRSLAVACRAYHTEFGHWPIPQPGDKAVGGTWESENHKVVNMLLADTTSGGNGKANYIESVKDQVWTDPFKSNLPYRITIDVRGDSVTVSSYGPNCVAAGDDDISVKN